MVGLRLANVCFHDTDRYAFDVPFDDIEGKLRLTQFLVLSGLMYLRQNKILNTDEATLLMHPILLILHAVIYINCAGSTWFPHVFMLNFIHSLLPTHNIQLDLPAHWTGCFTSQTCMIRLSQLQIAKNCGSAPTSTV